MFLQLCVILFTGGLSGMENPPPGKETPLGRETPPSSETPHQGEPPSLGRETPPPGIRSMSGRYASYWNAFLFTAIFQATPTH